MTDKICVRMSDEERRLLRSVCKARGEDMSSFVRRAIKKELASLNFLSDETKKALGLRVQSGEK